jgi:CBS domain-containing membrane protein
MPYDTRATKDPPMLKAKDLMTLDVFTLKENDSLRMARSMMSLARIRHIPIVNDAQQFIGLLTHRDLLTATISKFADVDKSVQDEIDSGIPIREIMRSDIRTIATDTPLREVAEILLHHKYGCLPVVDAGLLKGIITEADFLKLTITLMDAMEQI